LTGFGSVRFLGQKPVWLGFSGLARFWLGLARFFSGFLSVSVRFFRFFSYKTETEPAGFFKILIGLIGFFLFGFFSYFFFWFSRSNQFFDFFLPLTLIVILDSHF
jgi:hypothetical protein